MPYSFIYDDVNDQMEETPLFNEFYEELKRV